MNNDINEKIVHAAPVPPFVRFVASAVPMVFDNSLSYYEALCALWKWMQDNLVDVINNNATVTEHYIEMDEETRQLFIELKSYVDNYFDNLDVQEEINNKLDEMAEAGTLQEIITTYIQSNVAWTFDTISDMQSATNLVAGSYAQTLGSENINDGGANLYHISDTGTVDNLNTFAVGDGLYATVVNAGARKISLEQLESVGAGVYTLGRVTVDSPINFPRLNNRNIIIVDTTFDINTPVLMPAYDSNRYFILPCFVGCTFNNVTSPNSRVVISSDSSDIVVSKITGCNFINVDLAIDNGYVQDANLTSCYIQSHTCFIETSGRAQVRMVNCTVESESSKLIDANTLTAYFSGTYEGNINKDFYFIKGNTGIVTLDNAWIESCKFLYLVGGTQLVNKSQICVTNSSISGGTDDTPNVIIDNPEYIELYIFNSHYGAYNQNSRFCNIVPGDFFAVKGAFSYKQAKSYVKEMGGENTCDYALVTEKQLNDQDSNRFKRQEILLQANVGKDFTYDCGTYLVVLGRGSYGAMNKVNIYVLSVSKNQNYCYINKMCENASDNTLNKLTLTPTKTNASDTTFNLNILSPSAFVLEFEMIKLY